MAKIHTRTVKFSAVLCFLLFIGVLWSRPSDHRDDEPRAAADVRSNLPASHTLEGTFSPIPLDGVKEDHIQGPGSSPESLKMEMVTLLHMVYPGTSDKILLRRVKEYVTALQSNLNHDHVKRIHVLTENTRTLEERLSKHQLTNRSKLLIVERKSTKQLRDVYEYISESLIGVDVIHLNGDIYLGGGFDRVDPVVMRKNKIMYALTRQVKREESCGQKYGQKDWCHEWKYSSHDTFLFHLTEPIPEAALQYLNFTPGCLGMENVLMWMFKTKLGYCLLNPCTILETFHLHCSNLRNKRIKVSTKSTFGVAHVTKDLVCDPAHNYS